MTFSFGVHGERAVGSLFPVYVVRLYMDGRQVRPGWWRFSFTSAMRKGEKEAARANRDYGRKVR